MNTLISKLFISTDYSTSTASHAVLYFLSKEVMLSKPINSRNACRFAAGLPFKEMKMRRKWIVLALVIILSLALVPAAQAITFGEPDGNAHPNVGAMIMEYNGEYYFICSGTLIDPQVFLTAAHCTAVPAAYGVDPNDVFVTFESDIFGAALLRGTYYTNPAYGHDMHDLNDIAVIVLDEPVFDITPAELPPLGLLDEMKADKELKDQEFVAVGYGELREDKTGGPHALTGDYGVRYFAEQTFLALKPYWLQISMNPSTDSGGTCYGDSGGPHFLGDSNLVVSITVTGDAWCRATDVTYRLDTDSAQGFLSGFVDLPQ